MSTFSDDIREAIRNSGMARYQIARQIGIGEAAMSRFMGGQGGLSFKTLDALAEVLGLSIVVDPEKRRPAMLTSAAEDVRQLRLRFINNEFHEVVRVPPDVPIKVWEVGEREAVRRQYGADATLSHYTHRILTERPDDSEGLRERRKTIPSWVYERFNVSQ